MRTSILVAMLAPALAAQTPGLTHGPFRGHVGPTSLHVWARASEPGAYTLILTDVVAGAEMRVAAAAAAEHDHVLHFAATGLPAGSAHTLRIVRGERAVHDGGGSTWTTALPDDASAATIAFGSCANEKSHPEQPIWARILARAPHGLVLLGDTPYIDLGTVAARRARHRDFFAHAPVAAALRAIPTWTAWDDHDYTANDEFGAVPGSETARPVFVEYHAHAGYGDGARGIWTRFRQGPIEVFLLDTRSCADTEPSVLAPGHRSLLGRAQTAWLQQGLAASTAAIKVLTSGMVWNGAVRPGKKDCWGNWFDERDALFRWIGAQRIEGVVLVGGDVHRSRVILHPTAAVVGYDLPEFVTSPLAQNVIEANAVPVLGLVFDAGEPHSCLFLTATTANGGDVTLRAVFQAGDGREFHVREFAPDYERLPASALTESTLEPSPQGALAPAWRDAVTKAEPALQAWRRALLAERCRFKTSSSEPPMSEYMQDLFLGLRRLQALGVARTVQAANDGDADGALRGVAAHLGLARHLQQEPGGIAWGVAASLEREAVLLHDEVASRLGTAAAERTSGAIRDHLARRQGLPATAVALRIETFRLCEATMASLRLGSDRQSQAARTLGADVRREFVRRVDPLFALGDTVTEDNLDAASERFARLVDELTAEAKERSQALQELRQPGALGADAASDLGLLLTRLLLPNLPELLRTQADALRALREAVR
jgi:alkaline phosphatase D